MGVLDFLDEGLIYILGEDFQRKIGNAAERANNVMDRNMKNQMYKAAKNYDESDQQSMEDYEEKKKVYGDYQHKSAELKAKIAEYNYRVDTNSSDPSKRYFARQKFEGRIHRIDAYLSSCDEYMKQMERMVKYKPFDFKTAIGDIIGNTKTIKNSLDEDDEIFGLYNYLDKLTSSRKYCETVEEQNKLIQDVLNGKIELTSREAKGNFGEMVVDQILLKNGYVRMNLDIQKTLKGGHQGVDGVYCCPDGEPMYIVVESKYGSSKQSTIKTGEKQGSVDYYINDDRGKSDRIYQALQNIPGEVGMMADDIFEGFIREDGTVMSLLANIKLDGSAVFYELDPDGNKTAVVEFE